MAREESCRSLLGPFHLLFRIEGGNAARIDTIAGIADINDTLDGIDGQAVRRFNLLHIGRESLGLNPSGSCMDGPEGIILIILSIVLSVVSVFGSVLVNIFYSRQGAAALGAYSSITTLINYVNTLLVIPAEALFYIACGRYTAK